MVRRSRVLVFVLVLVVIAVVPMTSRPAAQETITAVSIDEAVAIALRHSAVLRAKQLELQVTRSGEITAALRPNPVASYAAEQLGSGNVDPQHTVTLGQPIETGGKRGRRIASAQAATRVAALEVDDVRRQVVAQVKKSFNDVLIGQTTLALAEQNLRTLDDVERIQRIRADRGDISELELLRIEIQRFAFERDAADARQAARAARIALRTTLGLDRVAEDVEARGELAYRDVPLDRATLHRRALDRRPDLRAAEAARDKARADLELARANAWWDVTPQVEYQRIGNDNTIGFGISVPLRVFDRNQGEIARTRAEIERTAAQRDAVLTQALAEVDTLLAAAASERDKVRTLGDVYLPKAAKARDTVEFAYRRGGLSLLDFLDAQRTYRETALEHLRALGNYWSAVYQLEAAVGGPLEK